MNTLNVNYFFSFMCFLQLFLFPSAVFAWFSELPAKQKKGESSSFPQTNANEEQVWLGVHDCLCQVSGNLGDCSCDVESLDSYNSRFIYPALRELTYRDYFKYFKVNLYRECSFWPDDGKCVLRDCAVEACSVDQLPRQLQQNGGVGNNKNGDESTTQTQKEEPTSGQEGGNEEKAPCAKDSHSESDEEKQAEAEALSKLDSTIADQMLKEFEVWEKHDALNDNFCYVENENDPEAVYVDLTLNPERYTGYVGASTQRIWSAIYKENCFKVEREPEAPNDKSDAPLHSKENHISKKEEEAIPASSVAKQKEKFTEILNSYTMNNVCTEKRVFYRLISGLHASINVHLSAKYMQKSPLGEMTFGLNLTEFRKRFDPAIQKEGPQWLKNIYLLYLAEMKAVYKARHMFSELQFFTNADESDVETKNLVLSLMKSIEDFPSHFDESTLFKEKEVQSLKEVYKVQFRNISRIMDCVGCDKCRLWGKVQTQGLGTALKILFAEKEIKLTRNEIVTLFNGFAQLSESIWHIHEFREMSANHQKETQVHSEL